MRINDESIDSRIAARLRVLRAEKGLTLDALARLADVSRAMLSRIERAESSPTAQLLNRICGGLGITLPELFADVDEPMGPVSRHGNQPVWRDPSTGYLRRNVSPSGRGSSVRIVEIEFPPRTDVRFDAQRLPSADQHVWVLEGTLEMELGPEAFRLEKGDCLMMRFDRPVTFRNPDDRWLRYAVVISHGPAQP